MDRREALQKTALLMGAALTPGLSNAILSGCTPTIELNWTPEFLTTEEVVITGQIADRIIPQTETPGALEVGVDQFIDKMLIEVYSANDRQAYRDGLALLNSSSIDVYGKEFVKLEPESKDSHLRKFESEKQRVFQISKELTLVGYFTSEEGMKSNFEYRPVPGVFDPCVPYKPGDKLWIGNHVINL